MSKWQEVSLGDIADFVTDKIAASSVTLDNYISTDNMQVDRGGVVPAATLPQASKFNHYKPTDTLFSNIRTYFRKVWLADRAGGASADVLIFRTKDEKKLNPLYLYYLISGQEFVDFTVLTAKGAKMPRGDKGAMMQFKLHLPSPDEQIDIANSLRCIDQKIELNQRMNETLEGMARAIFKSWFVDFDPVHAKAEGRQPEGMDSQTAALFPSTFTPDGLPEGWKKQKVSEAIELNPTERLPKGTIAPYLDMAALPTQGSWPDNPIEREFKSGSKFKNGDTLLARITPCLENGKTAYIDCLEDNQICWGSTEFIVMRPKPPLVSEYAYILARSNEFRDHAIQSMTGTSGRQRVQNDALGNFEICIPSEKVSEAFGDFVRPLFKKIKANSEQNQTLAALRDTLLPKLISGELRVYTATEPLKEAMG